MPELTINATWFIALIFFTALLMVLYYRGHRKNMYIIQTIAATLEQALDPSDKNYTWLGGVTGFSATYTITGFKEVQAVLTLRPRQSLLYLPFVFLGGTRDQLQLLFFLDDTITEESHIIPVKRKHPLIHNRDRLKSMEEECAGIRIEILYDNDPSFAKEVACIVQDDLHSVNHIALTPEKSVFYIEINPSTIPLDDLKELIQRTMMFITVSL
jgi:hypothetical protein